MKVALAVIVMATSAHATRLVIADGKSASLVEAGATSAKLVATIKLPADVQQIVWIDRDPVVLLEGGAVGALTARGFVAMAPPPSTAFALARPRQGTTKLDRPLWQLVGSTADELWLGRCDWAFFADGMTICENWVYARLGGGAALSSRAAPTSANPDWRAWSTVSPPATVSISFAKRPHDEHDMADTAQTMTCRSNGTATTFPDDTYSWTEPDHLRWISRDPPIFVIDALAYGFTGIVEPTVFEGCKRSARFVERPFDGPPEAMSQSAEHTPAVVGYTGPGDLFVLATTSASSLRVHGKELLALPGASFVAFEPPAIRGANDAFALLERELAGDAAMFAADALVLAPAPIAGAPKLAKHVGARIERFATQTLGDATSFAAELVLDGAPYRTLQLIDASGRVIVATFAPVKSLSAGGVAPALPSATPAGPLATLAASPTNAAKAAREGTAVFGTELGEHAVDDGTYAPDLLASWSKLALTLDPSAREVHTASYGYAIATVALGKSRMIALVIGAPDKAGWKLVAIHYLAL